MKTFTPELSPPVLGRLAEYAASFAEEFPQTRPALWAGVYLPGLLLDGDRKSIEWKRRWAVEQACQQMKEELGLDHLEGRSWRGRHHHAALVMPAYGFLLLERHRGEEHPVAPEKKGAGGNR